LQNELAAAILHFEAEIVGRDCVLVALLAGLTMVPLGVIDDLLAALRAGQVVHFAFRVARCVNVSHLAHQIGVERLPAEHLAVLLAELSQLLNQKRRGVRGWSVLTTAQAAHLRLHFAH